LAQGGLGFREAEPPAELAQRVLLVAGEHGHLADEARHVSREDAGDETAPPLGQRDGQVAAVISPARAPDEAAAEQVAHDHRGIRVAPQEFLPDIALAERPVVQERFQRAELADGQPRPRHHAAYARGERLGRAHQLDVGVESCRLGGAAGVPCRHDSN
jgi:hypothetical protein